MHQPGPPCSPTQSTQGGGGTSGQGRHGGEGVHCCLDSPVAAAADANNADICTIKQKTSNMANDGTPCIRGGSQDQDRCPWLAAFVLTRRMQIVKEFIVLSYLMVIFVCCKTIFTAGSSKLTILAFLSHAQVMPPCNYVAKTARTWYHHCKFYPAGVNFDEDAVGQNWQGRRVSIGSG
jgi:hypothetical protein